jgi:hypothetical protein
MRAAHTTADSRELSKGWRPMTEEELVRRVDAGVSTIDILSTMRKRDKLEHFLIDKNV